VIQCLTDSTPFIFRASLHPQETGGGLCLIYRNTLTVKSHPLQSTLRYSTTECQVLNLNASGSSSSDDATVASFRPPSSSLPTLYEKLSYLFDTVSNIFDADQFIACDYLNGGGADSTSVSDDLLTLLEAHVCVSL
jgi:hypothetical protein